MILKISPGSVDLSCSGQSGSGKTEAAKLIVHYLSFLYEDRNDHLRQVFTVLRNVQSVFFFKCWQSIGRHPLQPSFFCVIPARGSVSHSGEFRKRQDHPQQQLQPLRQIPPHPHSPVGLPFVTPSATWCVHYLCNLQWETNSFMLTVCPLGWKRGHCRHLIVQIPAWEVQGGFPGENSELCSDVMSHTRHRNMFETAYIIRSKALQGIFSLLHV